MKKPQVGALRITFGVSEEEKKKSVSIWSVLFFTVPFSLFVIGITNLLSPETIPFGFFELWKPKGSVLNWLVSGWPILVWGVTASTVYAVSTRNDPDMNNHPHEFLAGGALFSLWAGVVEEICFRWVIFLAYMVGAIVLNFIFFKWVGLLVGQDHFNFMQALNEFIVFPVVNFTTFGALGDFFGNGVYPWYVGAGLITTNALFRDGHKYQGTFGYINSWFGGMFFFWIMFRHGLPAAILLHFLYDMLIVVVHYIDALVEGRQQVRRLALR